MKQSYPKLHSVKWKDGALAENVEILHPHLYGREGIPARDCLLGAYEADLTDIVIAGYDADGDYYLFGNNPDYQKAHYILSRATKILLQQEDD